MKATKLKPSRLFIILLGWIAFFFTEKLNEDVGKIKDAQCKLYIQ